MATIEVFLSYAHEDEPLRKQLEKHLQSLKRVGLIDVWHDREIRAGEEWKQKIDLHLNTATIILLLISPDFIDSDYCYSLEMKRAMERHERGEAHVIPIILRPVNWSNTPFRKLQALPKDAKPVRSKYWRNQDEAFYDIAKGIQSVIEQLGITNNILRDKSLLSIIDSIGLTDIENRNDRGTALPPEQFYEMAKHEIVITGVSAYRTFDQNINLLRTMLKAGKRLYILILHPDSEDVVFLSQPELENHDIRLDILSVINKAKRFSREHQGFRIRFMKKLPPFTGVMIDGNVEPVGELLDIEGLIRVQPRAVYKTLHKGFVLQFKKIPDTTASGFDYFGYS